MERKNVVKRLLESMFENNDLISATVNVKSGLSIVNLRFDNAAILDLNSEPITYVKKSRYHAVRDKERSELHRQSKRERKQTKFYDAATENPRFSDHENSVVSVTGLSSPSSVYMDASFGRHDTPPLCVAESPESTAHHDATQGNAAACSVSLFSRGTQNDSPTVHDIVEMESTSHITTQEDQFVNSAPGISLPQPPEIDKELLPIKCHDCKKNFHKLDRVTYCKNCDFYFCEPCNQDPKCVNENGEGNVCFCNETLQDIT